MPRIAPVDLRAYVILDPDRLPDGALLRVARQVFDAGIPTVQLRHKCSDTRLLTEEARELTTMARGAGARFIVNDRIDVALEVGAHGVHLGPDDMSVVEAREAAPGLIIGASAGTVERALELEAEGADYLGCGAVWDARPSKLNASAPRGLEMIGAISSAVSIPIVGIGGITMERAPSVIAAGAAGVAVIRAIADAESPFEAGLALLEATRVAPAH